MILDFHSRFKGVELSGIFNWVLNGLDRILINKKFTNCTISDKIVYGLETSTDSVKSFIEEYCEKSRDKKTSLNSIFINYQKYCNEEGFYPIGKTNLSNRLEEEGIKKNRANYGITFSLSPLYL